MEEENKIIVSKVETGTIEKKPSEGEVEFALSQTFTEDLEVAKVNRKNVYEHPNPSEVNSS